LGKGGDLEVEEDFEVFDAITEVRDGLDIRDPRTNSHLIKIKRASGSRSGDSDGNNVSRTDIVLHSGVKDDVESQRPGGGGIGEAEVPIFCHIIIGVERPSAAAAFSVDVHGELSDVSDIGLLDRELELELGVEIFGGGVDIQADVRVGIVIRSVLGGSEGGGELSGIRSKGGDKCCGNFASSGADAWNELSSNVAVRVLGGRDLSVCESEDEIGSNVGARNGSTRNIIGVIPRDQCGEIWSDGGERTLVDSSSSGSDGGMHNSRLQ